MEASEAFCDSYSKSSLLPQVLPKAALSLRLDSWEHIKRPVWALAFGIHMRIKDKRNQISCGASMYIKPAQPASFQIVCDTTNPVKSRLPLPLKDRGGGGRQRADQVTGEGGKGTVTYVCSLGHTFIIRLTEIPPGRHLSESSFSSSSSS